MLPFPLRFAVLTDLLLNALAAVVGPEHVMLVPEPMTQFGILVAAGIACHEVSATIERLAKAVSRWWHRRQRVRP